MEKLALYDTIIKSLEVIDLDIDYIGNKTDELFAYLAINSLEDQHYEVNPIDYILNRWKTLKDKPKIKEALETIIKSYNKHFTIETQSIQPYSRLIDLNMLDTFKNIYIKNKTRADILDFCIHLTKTNNLPVLKIIMEEMPYLVNQTDKDYGNTLIMYACQHNNLEIMKYFLERGADLLIKNTALFDALHYSFSYMDDNGECFKYLIENHLPLDDYGRYLRYLRGAINLRKSIQLIKFIVNYGYRWNYQFPLRETLLILIKGGYLTIAYDLTLGYTIQEDDLDWSGILREVLQITGNPSFQNKQPNTTIPDIITRLLKMGAKVDEVDELGNTPIFYANKADIIQVFIDFEAELSHRNHEGKTAYECATDRRLSIPCLKILNIDIETKEFIVRSKHINKKSLLEILQRAGCYDVEVIENY